MMELQNETMSNLNMNYNREDVPMVGNHNRRKHSQDETGYIVNFGEKMKRIRQSKGWTLKMAEEKGYPSWRHLSDIENGKKSVTIVTLLRLSRLYEIGPSELLKDL